MIIHINSESDVSFPRRREYHGEFPDLDSSHRVRVPGGHAAHRRLLQPPGRQRQLPRFLSGRPEPGPCGHRHERGGQRHEQLPADGPARPCLPLRSAGGHLDLHRPCRRHLSQLAHRGPAHPPLFRPPWGHHRAGLLLPPLRRPAPRALLHRGHRDPGILYPLHRLRLQGCGHPLQQPLRL